MFHDSSIGPIHCASMRINANDAMHLELKDRRLMTKQAAVQRMLFGVVRALR
jgi:hypothetical protein